MPGDGLGGAGLHQIDQPGDVLDRRLGQNAMAEIEDEGARAQRLEDRRDATVELGVRRQRGAPDRDCPAPGRCSCNLARIQPSGMLVSQPIGIDRRSPWRSARQARLRRAGSRSRAMSGSFGLDQLDQPLGRGDAPALEFVLGQAAGPAVEDLQDARAGLRPGSPGNRRRPRPGDRSGAGRLPGSR